MPQYPGPGIWTLNDVRDYVQGDPSYPTTSSASDVWSLRDVYKAEAGGDWPFELPVGDLNFANVSLLINADGLADGSTAFVDESNNNHTITANGNAQVDTAVFKYGTGSAKFDGVDDYLELASNSVFDLDAGDFTVEFWFNSPDISGTQTPVGVITSTNGWVIRLNANKIAFIPYIGGSFQFILGDITTLSSNTWYHIAVTRNGNDFKLFINGTLEDSETNSVTLLSGNPLKVGRWDGYPTRDFNGYIDDLRITKGVALYTSNFTPPTEALPTS
jgi:hypothetical protein